MVPNGTEWCWMVPKGTKWCQMVRNGSEWCPIAPDLCRMVVNGAFNNRKVSVCLSACMSVRVCVCATPTIQPNPDVSCFKSEIEAIKGKLGLLIKYIKIRIPQLVCVSPLVSVPLFAISCVLSRISICIKSPPVYGSVDPFWIKGLRVFWTILPLISLSGSILGSMKVSWTLVKYNNDHKRVPWCSEGLENVFF